MNKKKRKIFRIIWFTFVGIFLTWNFTTFQSRNLPDGIFSSDEKVLINEDEDQIVFTPWHHAKNLQIIFFQGGLTDPKAYAPLCRKIAEEGYPTHLIKMDWRLPQYDYQKISKMFDFRTSNYVLGGHSQGAKMAAQYVFEHPNLLEGLFLMGTSHPRDIDMSNLAIPTLKLYAQNDGLASVEEVMENKDKLPQHAQLVMIEGGNHSQFGYLGQLLLDNSPNISLDEQQDQILRYLLNFFDGIDQEIGQSF